MAEQGLIGIGEQLILQEARLGLHARVALQVARVVHFMEERFDEVLGDLRAIGWRETAAPNLGPDDVVEVVTRGEGRRRWSADQKRRIVVEAMQPGVTPTDLAQCLPDFAVAAMREGAADYIVKPFEAAALIELTQRLLASRSAPDDLIAEDPESQRVLALAARIAQSDATVLLTGPSGTGKEVAARAVHRWSRMSST